MRLPGSEGFDVAATATVVIVARLNGGFQAAPVVSEQSCELEGLGSGHGGMQHFGCAQDWAALGYKHQLDVRSLVQAFGQ